MSGNEAGTKFLVYANGKEYEYWSKAFDNTHDFVRSLERGASMSADRTWIDVKRYGRWGMLRVSTIVEVELADQSVEF